MRKKRIHDSRRCEEQRKEHKGKGEQKRTSCLLPMIAERRSPASPSASARAGAGPWRGEVVVDGQPSCLPREKKNKKRMTTGNASRCRRGGCVGVCLWYWWWWCCRRWLFKHKHKLQSRTPSAGSSRSSPGEGRWKEKGEEEVDCDDRQSNE